MAKKIQLTIAEPCHENWENMSPVQQGKFCGSCQKQVVDFSNMSDRQVAEFFKKPSTGSVCGRFMTDQLDRPMDIPRKRIPWVKYFFQFALPAFLMSMKVSAQKTKGTVSIISKDTAKIEVNNNLRKLGEVSPVCIKPVFGDTIITPVKNPVDNIKGKVLNVVPDLSKRTIFGTVTDEKGEPLQGVSIILKGTVMGVSADNLGQFRISAKKGDILVVAGVGFETKEVVIETGTTISIALKRINFSDEGIEVIAGMIMVSRPTKKELKNVPLMKENFVEPSAYDFKIFPNPVSSGSMLTIDWTKKEGGQYTLQLISLTQQVIEEKEIRIDAKSGVLNVDVPNVAAGSYFLVLTNKKTKKSFTEKIIIQ